MSRSTTLAAVVAVSGALTLALAGPASASVTVSSSGTGFVGKGDVQTAMGWNNAQLQKSAEALTFTSKQAAAQALSSTATQTASQAATQSVSQDVTCELVSGRKTFHRDGVRPGSREGSRDGSRTGTRAGSLDGFLASDVAYEARKSNQFTGFTLTGFAPGSPVFVAGATTWSDPTFDDWAFGDYAFGDVEWDGWVAEPGENPADCLGGNPGVTNLVDVLTEGTVVDGPVTEGAVGFGQTEYGSVTPTGPAQLYVNVAGTTPVLVG